MKVNQIINQIDEAKFDTQLTNLTPWHNKTGTNIYLRTGKLANFEVVVSVKFNKIAQLNLTGACVEFGLRVPGAPEFEYNIGAVPNAPTGQIFGAVITVLRGALPAHWDFMYAEAKDGVTTRIRLYTALFSRFASHYHMIVDSIHDQQSGGVVMARQQDMEPIKQLASQVFL